MKQFLGSFIAVLLAWAPGLSCTPSCAQATSLSQIKTLYVDSLAGDPKDAVLLRSSLIRRLEKESRFVVVQSQKGADVVITGRGEIWRRGFITTNSRTPWRDHQAVYSGYLSLEAVSADGQPLWSWLATPGKLMWSNIVDELTGRAAEKLISAIKSAPAPQAETGPAPAHPQTTLTGAGATFPGPIYRKWFEDFEQTHPGTNVQYALVGSQLGIESLLAGRLDFAGSDIAPDQVTGAASHANVRRFATVLGAVVPIYNVKGGLQDLHFTPDVLADIYLGKVRRWNDPELRRSNRGANLPDEEIVVIHRSDGSGTTWVWSDFLSKISPAWSSAIGRGMTLQWPVGVGAEYNDGVSEAVQKTPNAIGYVELSYAIQRELTFGAVRNRAGEYIHADLDSLSEAAKDYALGSGQSVPSITDAAGKHAYPIAALTWILVPEQVANRDKREAITELLRWVLTTGQKQCSALGYVPLPHDLAEGELRKLNGEH